MTEIKKLTILLEIIVIGCFVWMIFELYPECEIHEDCEINEMCFGGKCRNVPYRGEPCEEYNPKNFVYNSGNTTDYFRVKMLWNEYTLQNNIKGYCKNGRRIGGLIG